MKGSDYIPDLNRLSTAKPKNFDELVKIRSVRTAPQPLEQTLNIYQELNKKSIEKEILSKSRESQLEEISKRKRVFTGESNTIYFDPKHPKRPIFERKITNEDGLME